MQQFHVIWIILPTGTPINRITQTNKLIWVLWMVGLAETGLWRFRERPNWLANHRRELCNYEEFWQSLAMCCTPPMHKSLAFYDTTSRTPGSLHLQSSLVTGWWHKIYGVFPPSTFKGRPDKSERQMTRVKRHC